MPKEMKTVVVTLPVTGYATVEIECEASTGEAEMFNIAADEWSGEADSLDIHKVVCQGNVYYGELNEPEYDVVAEWQEGEEEEEEEEEESITPGYLRPLD